MPKTRPIRDWHDTPAVDTPINAIGLEGIEDRAAGFVEEDAGAYKLIVPWRSIIIPAATANSTLVLPGASAAGIPAATTDSPLGLLYLDPADYAMASLATKYRLRATLATNATAPGDTITAGLYPVSAVAGGAGAITLTLGALVTGSSVAFASQALSTLGQGNSGDFTPPTAGFYALAAVISGGATAANSRVALSACLQRRNV